MVIFLFHQANLLLVLDLPPGKLTVGKLHQHVEQRPKIIVATWNILNNEAIEAKVKLLSSVYFLTGKYVEVYVDH